MKLLLFHPVKYMFITQQFGQANAWKLANGNIVGSLIRPDGALNFYTEVLKHKGHNGLDIAAKRGLEVYASHAGVVIETSTDQSKGLEVHLRTELEVETTGYKGFCKTIYIHLQGLNVKVGEKITVGQLLGWADNTGNSGGDHLHFGVAPCGMNGKKLFEDNGYGGYIDPNPYMSTKTALEARGAIRRLLEAFAISFEKFGELARLYR